MPITKDSEAAAIGSRVDRSDDDLKSPSSTRNLGEKGNGKGEGGAQQTFGPLEGPATDKFGEGRTQSPSNGLFRESDKPCFGGSIDVSAQKFPEASGQRSGEETGFQARAGVVCGQSPRPRRFHEVQPRRAFQGGIEGEEKFCAFLNGMPGLDGNKR